MSFPTKYLLCSLLAVLLAGGCEQENPMESDDSEEEVTFSSIQSDIFDQSCALSGCHRGANAPQGLDLSQGAAYDNLVNIASNEVSELMLVEPGNPDDSYLVIKLEGGDRMAEGTARMPRGRTPLSSAEINRVRDWIANGAPDN